MTEIKIKIINLEPAERGVARFHDMFSAQALLVRQIAAPENFAGNDERIAWPVFVFDDFSHDNLGLAACVSFGVVEKIHAGVIGNRHQLHSGLTINLLAEGDPRTKR
jgi:hypothetical protein